MSHATRLIVPLLLATATGFVLSAAEPRFGLQGALAQMGYTGVGAVHVGKYLEIELAGADKETARKQINEACHRILSNPVIEDYRFEIE